MAAPAIVQGDQVTGTCPLHQIPGPVGNPQPGPPMPFSAPLTMGLCPTVLIGGKPAAVVGASGYNMPPHVGLHPADPFMVPVMQVGMVTSGSPTVTFGGQPAVSANASATCCASPGSLVPSVMTVMVG
ncbi:MAG: PAAR domain-containing protein [Chloroflexi bacterium]|nr:PAAR domain-containing protein [Chloroflexota bacterium]